MSRTRLLVVALVAVAGAAVLFATRREPPAADDVAALRNTDAQSTTVPAPTRDDATPFQAAPAATPPGTSIRLRPPDPMAANFAATDDLLAFVEGIHESARSGDGASAYYMFRALDRCQSEYGLRFGGSRRERPLDEVLADESVVSQFGDADLRRIHGQCQRLRETDPARFGALDEWLVKAANAGYPRAQAEWALRLVNGAAGSPDGDALERAREMARAALASKDPAVFVPVSSVIRGLSEQDANRDASWFVAACQRGFDCSPGSEMTRIVCRFDANCQPYESSLDLLRRHSGGEFETIERGARAINAAIEAGRFEELGL